MNQASTMYFPRPAHNRDLVSAAPLKMISRRAMTDLISISNDRAMQHQPLTEYHGVAEILVAMRICNRTVQRWQRKLKEMQCKYHRACSFSESNNSLLYQSISYTGRLKQVESKNQAQLLTCGPIAQSLLEARILAMGAEADLLQAKLEAMRTKRFAA